MSLYDDLQPDHSVSTPFFTSLSTKLGLPVPNPAPEIEEMVTELDQVPPQPPVVTKPPPDLSNEPKKKKYAKEAWPGKKHGIGSNLLV